MAYGQWKVNVTLTKQEFGYFPKDLTKFSHKPVKVVCKQCGCIGNKRLSESNRKHICNSIINNEKRCFKCKQFKDVSDFSKNRSTSDGYQKVCKNCFAGYESVKRHYKNKTIKYKTTLKQYFSQKVSNIRRKSEIINLPFDLDTDFLLDLYKNQDGKCYYSNIEMKHNIGVCSFNSISLERLDPNKGYVKTNVVFCANGINSFKGNLSMEEFKEMLQIVLPALKDFSERGV